MCCRCHFRAAALLPLAFVLSALAGPLSAAPQPAAAGLPATIAALAMPGPGEPPANAVSFAVVQEVALKRARAVWPALAAGPVVPYQDYEGRTTAYAFHFRIDGSPFPESYQQAVRENREDIDRFAAEQAAGAGGRTTPPSGRFRYGYVLVSARNDRTPLLSYGEGLTEFYSTGWQARDEAAGLLGAAEPKLVRVFFVWPTAFFQFAGGEKSVVLDAHLFSRSLSEPDFVAQCRASVSAGEQEMAAALAKQGRTMADYTAELKQRSEQEWQRALKGPVGRDGQGFVPGYDKAPFYDWSYGCTPTSGAMILGWLDDYQHFGRLVAFYFRRWDPIERDTDYNVPDCQLDLVAQMGTDTNAGTTPYANISPGMVGVVARLKNYAFGSSEYDNYHVENNCWDEATAAITNGHAFIWSLWRQSDNFAHSMAVFGCDFDADLYWLHNTWDPPGAWWHYTDNGNATYIQVDEAFMTQAAPTNYIHMYEPIGDTRYNQDGQGETWHVWGHGPVITHTPDLDSVRAYFSNQGGVPSSWTFVASSQYGSPTVSVQPWMTSDAARIYVVLYKGATSGPVAGDGSHGNFHVVNTAPPTPTQQFPPNNSAMRATHPLKPTLFVSRIDYAQEYYFTFHNDSMGDFNSGWIADSSWREPVVLPVGSSGSWSAQARNPTGTSAAATATYQVVAGGFVHRRQPAMLTKKHPKKGASMAHKKKMRGGTASAEDELLYMMPGNNTRDFVQYSAWYDTWTVLCSLPAGPRSRKVGTGGCLVCDEDYAYAFKGNRTNEFWRYDPANNRWDSLPWPTFIKGLKCGFAVPVFEDTQWVIYAGSGANNNEWARYRVAAGRWEQADPPALPVEKAKAGSSLTWDGESTLYFLPGGTKGNEFYSLRLDQSPRTWTRLADLPLAGPTGSKKKVKEGGCIEFLQGDVYAVKGGGTREFWSYSPISLAWTYLGEVGAGTTEPPLKGIKCGRSLTAADDGIYVLIGNNTDGFYFYPVTPESLVSGSPGTMAVSTVPPAAPKFELTPNPLASGFATVSFTRPLDHSTTGVLLLSVYNVTGQAVLARALSVGRATSSVVLDLRHLSNGVYLVKLASGGYENSQKLVVQK